MNWPPFHPEARQEFDREVDHLGETSKALARRFVRRTMEVIIMLREFPMSGQPIGRHTRKFPLSPFSYDLIYLPQDDDVYLAAFAHHKRRPGYWRDRV